MLISLIPTIVLATTPMCPKCGFLDPYSSRPVGSRAWFEMEAYCHRKWDLYWVNGRWVHAPREQIEAVRYICSKENKAGNPLRYSGCAPDHKHWSTSVPSHAASSAYGIGQFLKATRKALSSRYPGRVDWNCIACQYRMIWVYIGPHRKDYKSPSSVVESRTTRGGNWRGY